MPEWETHEAWEKVRALTRQLEAARTDVAHLSALLAQAGEHLAAGNGDLSEQIEAALKVQAALDRSFAALPRA